MFALRPGFWVGALLLFCFVDECGAFRGEGLAAARAVEVAPVCVIPARFLEHGMPFWTHTDTLGFLYVLLFCVVVMVLDTNTYVP